MRRGWKILGLLGVLSTVAVACGSTNSTDTSSQDTVFTIATSMYPVTNIIENIVKDADVEVIQITPPGVGAHDHELTARELNNLSKVDAVFYFGNGLQPSLEKALEQLSKDIVVIDLTSFATTLEIGDESSHDELGDEEELGDEHGDTDPHVWLDPANMMSMTIAAEKELSILLPESANALSTNSKIYIEQLENLSEVFDAAFTTCSSRALVTSHDAFAYFANRAKLTTVPIAGINPENEPSTKELEAIADVAREQKVGTVFFEAQLPEAMAKTVASSIGAQVQVIDPIETISQSDLDAGADYFALQRINIDHIANGLGCL